jgi:hypothetical protein
MSLVRVEFPQGLAYGNEVGVGEIFRELVWQTQMEEHGASAEWFERVQKDLSPIAKTPYSRETGGRERADILPCSKLSH